MKKQIPNSSNSFLFRKSYIHPKIPQITHRTHGDSSQSPYPYHTHTHGNPHRNPHTHGSPALMLSFEGSFLTERHEISAQETRDSRLSYGENAESLSYLGLNRYQVVTVGQRDRQMDRTTIANTRLAVPAVARKKRCTPPNWHTSAELDCADIS